jgi:hypothetical protein
MHVLYNVCPLKENKQKVAGYLDWVTSTWTPGRATCNNEKCAKAHSHAYTHSSHSSYGGKGALRCRQQSKHLLTAVI